MIKINRRVYINNTVILKNLVSRDEKIMNKKRIVLATSLAILMAPSILNSIDSVAHVAEPIAVKAATTPKIGTLGYNVKLVDANGDFTGRILPAGSSWRLGELVTIKGNTYYQVGANAYADSVVMKINNNSSNTTSTGSSTATNTQQKVVGTLGYNVKVVDINGQPNGVVLPAGSSWQLGKLVTIKGDSYYQVATNEYVLAMVVKTNGSNAGSNVETAKVDMTVTVGNGEAAIVNDSGVVTGRTLPVGSSWKADQVKVINSVRYYRVATNKWIKRASTPVNNSITVTLLGNQKVYDTSSNTLTRSLPNGSSWKVSRVVVNNNNVYWGQVSNNEWIKISDGKDRFVNMSYGDADSVPSIAVKEPSFALNF